MVHNGLSVPVEGIAVPEPVLISMAAALASRTVIGLYQLVKEKFAGDHLATAALEAVEGAVGDSPEVRELSEKLASAEAADPEFARRLRTEWEHAGGNPHAESGGVINDVSGDVQGNVLQARDIHGDITFH
jgi:hypothetical protein